MRVLFLDDSYQKFNRNSLLGYGGYWLDAECIKPVTKGISDLKERYGIPPDVDLKWSPDRNHYLRTKFRGKRHNLYTDAITLLIENNARVLCAVHHLDSCYGVRLYNWDYKRTRLWATKQQCKFIAERFESVCLSESNQTGIIIADHYSDFEGETSLIKDIGIDFENGTTYCSFDGLCIPPLTATPQHCTPLQLADVIVGIIVSALTENRYGLALFEDVAKMFVLNPHKSATSFASTFSSGVLGWGLKLFPSSFASTGWYLFRDLDKRYIYTSERGLALKDIDTA